VVNPVNAYDAWKNFVLVIAGVLAGQMLSSYSAPGSFIASVKVAIESLLAFDRTLSPLILGVSKSGIIATLVVIYFIKILHGMLVGIFSESYYKQLQSSTTEAMVLIGLTTWSMVSLILVPAIAGFASSRTSVLSTGIALMAMVALPLLTIVPLDLVRFRNIAAKPTLRRLFSGDKKFEEIVWTWLLEDIGSGILLSLWLAIMLLPIVPEAAKIDLTIAILALYLILNSLFDYWANRSIFFDFRAKAKPKPSTRRKRDTAPTKEAPGSA
jgi:hypothetical protein